MYCNPEHTDNAVIERDVSSSRQLKVFKIYKEQIQGPFHRYLMKQAS